MTQLYKDKKLSGRPVKLSERSRRIIRRIFLRNRTMSVRSITSNFNFQRIEHISHDTVSKNFNKIRLTKLSAGSEAVYHFKAMDKKN